MFTRGWVFALLAIILATQASPAQATRPTLDSSIVDASAGARRGAFSRWSVEGSMQAHSLAGDSSPWLGIASAFRVLDQVELGLRGFVPLAQPVDKSAYAIQSFLRLRAVHTDYTDLFLEPEFAFNFYNFIPFTSYGMAAVALTRLGSGFSVGASAGIEIAQFVVDSIGLEERSDWVVYPKIALITNFNF